MSWVDAGPIPAQMVKFTSFRYGAIRSDIGRHMRADLAPLDRDLPIAITVKMADKNSTAGRLIDAQIC